MSSSVFIIGTEDNFGSLAEFCVDIVLLEAPIGVEVENEEKVTSFIHQNLILFMLAANVLIVVSQDVVFHIEIDHQFIEIVQIEVF